MRALFSPNTNSVAREGLKEGGFTLLDTLQQQNIFSLSFSFGDNKTNKSFLVSKERQFGSSHFFLKKEPQCSISNFQFQVEYQTLLEKMLNDFD